MKSNPEYKQKYLEELAKEGEELKQMTDKYVKGAKWCYGR